MESRVCCVCDENLSRTQFTSTQWKLTFGKCRKCTHLPIPLDEEKRITRRQREISYQEEQRLREAEREKQVNIDVYVQSLAPPEVIQEKLKVQKEQREKEKKIDIDKGVTEHLKNIIENSIKSKPKDENQIISEIKQMNFDQPRSNKAEVLEVMEALAKGFLSEGIEMDVTGTGSDLLNLHSLSPIEMTKISMTYEFSPIDKSSADEVLNDEKKSKEFKETIQKVIATQLQVPIETVFIVNLTRGSIKFDVIIGNPSLLARQQQTNLDYHVKLMEKKNQICNIMIDHFGLDGKPKQIDIQPFDQPIKFKLCVNDLDAKGDFHFPNPSGELQTRGGMKYFQPNNNWKRLGLHVLGLYDSNDWLMMDGRADEWAVGFHGTRGSSDHGITAITSTRFFAIGSAHVCQNHISKALHTNGQAYGGLNEEAVYFTKNIEDCYKLSHGGYEIAFQCRINPRYFYDSDPNNGSTYCVVRGSKNIRPYGLCFKKI